MKKILIIKIYFKFVSISKYFNNLPLTNGKLLNNSFDIIRPGILLKKSIKTLITKCKSCTFFKSTFPANFNNNNNIYIYLINYIKLFFFFLFFKKIFLIKFLV